MPWYLEPVRVVTLDYANFHGRASRKQFWLFQLFDAPLYCGLIWGLNSAGESTETFWFIGFFLYLLGLLLPRLALVVRRLHDLGGTGWIVFAFIALNYAFGYTVGSVVTFIVMALPGMKRSNKYGAVPGSKEAAAETSDSLRRRARGRRKRR